ncbi:hypothetical protein SNEBB_006871 [Seison nebaliae]|nr:hypothetical protein SNEBB_006871 [Seison nebaliae]
MTSTVWLGVKSYESDENVVDNFLALLMLCCHNNDFNRTYIWMKTYIEGLGNPTEDDSIIPLLLPIPAIILLSISVYLIFLIIISCIRKALTRRGICKNLCVARSKDVEDWSYCQCCAACINACDTGFDCNDCWDKCCCPKKKQDLSTFILCQCCESTSCTTITCRCACFPEECNNSTCCCFRLHNEPQLLEM